MSGTKKIMRWNAAATDKCKLSASTMLTPKETERLLFLD
jgi:hypothetical protein